MVFLLVYVFGNFFVQTGTKDEFESLEHLVNSRTKMQVAQMVIVAAAEV